MAARLRLPALALAAVSIGLNLAIMGCAGRTLSVFQTQRYTSTYFMPVWSSHFDTSELSVLIGTSAAVLCSNLALAAALFASSLPANLIVLASSVLSTLISLIAIIFSSVVNNRTGLSSKDTIQSWTCRWRSLHNAGSQGVPRDYDTLCHETRFAYYTTIPSFIIQLLLLCLALYAVMAVKKTRGVRIDEEKDHELDQVRHQSFETKTESRRSAQDSMRIIGTKE
ncbi:hypothetical protein DOTSEDRAFT_69341 [Dothistroma septosporum NZE10]|uniref:MARVEL domain-containing protein n=1 Tax=Dothistroma septosporum (strain NZE10 / CBS 128990) TaxID=675120 RepID=N1PY89_DOTSN|nr:hypothetical protein DOTSEDRAFT_69341 [Dothistroma septosporum NZE10]